MGTSNKPVLLQHYGTSGGAIEAQPQSHYLMKTKMTSHLSFKLPQNDRDPALQLLVFNILFNLKVSYNTDDIKTE